MVTFTFANCLALPLPHEPVEDNEFINLSVILLQLLLRKAPGYKSLWSKSLKERKNLGRTTFRWDYEDL